MNKQAQKIDIRMITQLEHQIDSVQKQPSDAAVRQLLLNIDQLSHDFSRDTTIVSLLKMMLSIGKYVEKKKHKAHMDSFTVLKHLSKGLADADNPGLSSAEKKQILQKNYTVFNQLRDKISMSASSPEQSGIYELKTALLSLEWEINSETLSLFRQKIIALKQAWNKNRLYCSFLNILNVLGKYIDHQKANAHKGTVVLIRMVYDHLEFIVFNPGLAFDKKKQMLARDIEKLNAFKRTITQKPEIPGKEIKIADLPPALSQYKRSRITSPGTLGEFFPLSDAQALACDTHMGDVADLLESPPENPHTDVMDDLFNPKSSPVDDLLDKIHLMNVLGEKKSNDKGTERPSSTTALPGVQEVIPKRMDKQPGQEIRHRIDEFFNLDPESPSSDSKADETVSDSPKALSPEISFHELRFLIDRAVESMTPDAIETIIREISKQDKNFGRNPENEQVHHLLLSCGKLIEKMADHLFRKNISSSKKITSLFDGLKRIVKS